jgi:type II secretory pathway component GspD/PulD (secretin)
MRKAVMGMTTLLLASLGTAETVTTARDYAVDSDVVLESAVREIKSIPQDTVNVVGDAVKMVADETVTAANGVKAVFKTDPVGKAETAASLETANAWNSANDVVFRSYKVSESVGTELMTGKESAAGSAVDVSDFFAGIKFPKGTSAMYRPEFKKLFVRQTLENVLAIEDVLAEQHSAKRELNGKQVEIQTKFVEVDQSTLNELGFNWRFENKNGGAANIFENLTLPSGQDIMAAGLRTSSAAIDGNTGAGTLLLEKTAGSLQWSMIISALEQSDNTDVLSAPSLTTRDGKAASIWVGEQRMVPKEFEAKSQNTSVFVENSGWESELIGVQLEVTPELRKGGLIDLELKPRVMDLIGYDTYQVTPDNASMLVWARVSSATMRAAGRFPILTQINGASTTLGNLYNSMIQSVKPGTSASNINEYAALKDSGTYTGPNYYYGEGGRTLQHDTDGIQVPSITGSLPYFRLREMKTTVTVADGSTVGMGGLIYDKTETYKDKVPVLGSIPLIGRLFRSEGEKSIKRNLMIFVTATEVDVNGRRSSDLAMKK